MTLDFERPIQEIKDKIEELKQSKNKISTNKEIAKLRREKLILTKKIFDNLSDWQIVQLSRHPLRPHLIEIIPLIFDNFQELHGDRLYKDDKSLIGGLGNINHEPVMIIGQEKGRGTKDKIYRNFGMNYPEGFRKSLRLMKLAEKFSIPIITFIDTPGAFPGYQAEKRGQSQAIANNLVKITKLNTPIIVVILGEGCSGGALGIGVGDITMMLEYSYFSVISPEGCASILWKDPTRAPNAAKSMLITSKHLMKLNIVDKVISEPLGGAHNNLEATSREIKKNIKISINTLKKLETSELRKKRHKKLMSYGVFSII